MSVLTWTIYFTHTHTDRQTKERDYGLKINKHVDSRTTICLLTTNNNNNNDDDDHKVYT